MELEDMPMQNGLILLLPRRSLRRKCGKISCYTKQVRSYASGKLNGWAESDKTWSRD